MALRHLSARQKRPESLPSSLSISTPSESGSVHTEIGPEASLSIYPKRFGLSFELSFIPVFGWSGRKIFSPFKTLNMFFLL